VNIFPGSREKWACFPCIVTDGNNQVDLIIDELIEGFGPQFTGFDPDLLKALQREIDSQNERLIHALSSRDVSDNEKEKAVEAARLQICHFLKQVLNFNDDVLPTKRLQNLWASNRCGT